MELITQEQSLGGHVCSSPSAQTPERVIFAVAGPGLAEFGASQSCKSSKPPRLHASKAEVLERVERGGKCVIFAESWLSRISRLLKQQV